MSNHAPNFEQFLDQLIQSEIVLSEQQEELATLLINYRRKHFEMGARGGRSFVVRQVQNYFDLYFPRQAEAGREV